jgi:hypothetical protein
MCEALNAQVAAGLLILAGSALAFVFFFFV